MKHLLVLASLFFLNSCVFDVPFETEAKLPVDPALLGRWEMVIDEVKPDATETKPERMLVLEGARNEYVIEYPIGEKAMYFRAFAIELAGEKFIQVQWIGTVEGPVKPEDRKYQLLKLTSAGDTVEIRTLDTLLFGKHHGDPERMKAAFMERKDNPKLFGDPEKFRKLH